MIHTIDILGSCISRDLREEFNAFSDLAYGEILSYCRRTMDDAAVRRLIMWPEDKKMNLFRQLKAVTSATDRQICKFLHLNVRG